MTASTTPAYFDPEKISLDDFRPIVTQTTDSAEYPLSATITKNIVIYEGAALHKIVGDAAQEAILKAELTHCLKDGPGVFVIKQAYADVAVIEKSTVVFEQIVAAEKASGQGQGDHFGSNERIWNSLQKACVADPDLFIDYYGNPLLGIACEAWLGPHFQMSAQMNNVKPGGKAQSAHRDYHLGFQSHATIGQFPAHAQTMSQYLTLQGAIVHSDMPLERGPTLFLPYSHHYPAGYLAFRRPEFAAYFDAHLVQLPFEKGDMVFFSPALFHAGGNNTTEVDRVANLVQISSAFGRTMETINTRTMIEAVYPALQKRKAMGAVTARQIADTLACAAESYAFPTNLDSDPPIGGNAPVTQRQMVQRALDEAWDLAQLCATLDAYEERRKA